MIRSFIAIFFASVLAVSAYSDTGMSKNDYRQAIEEAETKIWDRYESRIQKWRDLNQSNPAIDHPVPNIYWARMEGFLYHVTGELKYAERAREILLRNPRYENYIVVKTLEHIGKSGLLTRDDLNHIEKKMITAADKAVKYWVEWGAMNHATNHIVNSLAATLNYLPDHPNADVWRKKLEINISSSWGLWSIEDSQNYIAPWILPMMQYVEMKGNESEFYALPMTKYYFDYAVQLVTPDGQMAKFGDGGDSGDYTWYMVVPMLEKAATIYRDGRMKWAARRIFESNVHGKGQAFYSAMSHMVDAWGWADDTIEEVVPNDPSRLVLEDYVGKKIVFRSGWDQKSTYLFLNYMDDAPFGVDGREYMLNTINVEAEKNHHGQADENAICLLMKDGSVLLHDSGYRETSSTGPDGQFRADTYHNRLIAREGQADPQKRLLPFLLDGGQYHFVNTKLMHFRRYAQVDMSRSRIVDQAMGYQWDRSVNYLKEKEWFVIIDIVKILKDGVFTFADLYYTQDIMDFDPEDERWYDTRYRTVGTSWQSGGFALKDASMMFNPANSIYRNSENTHLFICFPEGQLFRKGAEQIRRCYQTEQAIYAAVSDSFKTGDILVFSSLLIPHDAQSNPREIAASLSDLKIYRTERGYGMKIPEDEGYTQINVMVDLEAEYLTENVRPRYNFESGRADYGALTTDARYCYLNRRGDRLYYAFLKASRLDYNDKTIFQGESMLFGQDDGRYRVKGIPKWMAWEDEIRVKGN